MSQFYGCDLILSSMRKNSVSLIKFLMSHEMTGLDCLLSSLPHLFMFPLPVFLLYIDVPISGKCVRNDAGNQSSNLLYQREKAEWVKLLLREDRRTHGEDGVQKKRNGGALKPGV